MPYTPKKPSGQEPIKPGMNFLLLGAGSVFTSMIIAGFLVGYVIDELFDTKPIFLLACGLLGFIGGSQKVLQLVSKMDTPPSPKDEDANPKSE